MWLKSLIAAAGCIPMLWSIESAGQTATQHATLTFTNSASGPVTRILRSTNGNVIIVSTNAAGSIPNRRFQFPEQQNGLKPSPSAPAPGVYRTEPYTCIVIVPGGHADDKSVIHPAEPGPNMPVLKPDLRFVPLPPK